MHVQARLLGALRRCRPDLSPAASLLLDVPDGTTVCEVVAQLGIPDKLPVMAMVNTSVCGLDHVLIDGDTVSLFLPVAGG